MSRYFLINRRVDDAGKYIELAYDYAGETKRIEPAGEREVSFDEAQVCLCRWQMAGVRLEERC